MKFNKLAESIINEKYEVFGKIPFDLKSEVGNNNTPDDSFISITPDIDSRDDKSIKASKYFNYNKEDLANTAKDIISQLSSKGVSGKLKFASGSDEVKEGEIIITVGSKKTFEDSDLVIIKKEIKDIVKKLKTSLFVDDRMYTKYYTKADHKGDTIPIAGVGRKFIKV